MGFLKQSPGMTSEDFQYSEQVTWTNFGAWQSRFIIHHHHTFK